jgi:nucleoside-diphosphate-sugar epimerase
LVTGGAGYFGSLLVQRLVDEGHCVRILDRVRPDAAPQGVEIVRADIRNARAVQKACEGIDVVHHNVALVPLAGDRSGFWSINEGGTRNVLEAALATRVRKVVHMSSSAIYGAPKKNPVDESSPPNPAEEYGQAKLAAELVCHEFRNRGLDVTIIRPRTIMGHGRLGIMQILFEWIRQGAAVPVLGGGRNVYQFIHADDLASACVSAAERPGSAEYNIGASQFGTMLESLQGLAQHAGTGSKIVSVPMWPAELVTRLAGRLGLSPLGPYHALMYGRSLWFDVRKAREELNFEPRFSNVQMLCHSYDWYVAHREETLSRRGASLHSMAVEQKALKILPSLLAWLPAARN